MKTLKVAVFTPLFNVVTSTSFDFYWRNRREISSPAYLVLMSFTSESKYAVCFIWATWNISSCGIDNDLKKVGFTGWRKILIDLPGNWYRMRPRSCIDRRSSGEERCTFPLQLYYIHKESIPTSCTVFLINLFVFIRHVSAWLTS